MAATLHCLKGSTDLQRLRGIPGISFLEEKDPNRVSYGFCSSILKFIHLVFDTICGNQTNFSNFEAVEGFVIILESYKFFLKRVIELGLTSNQVIQIHCLLTREDYGRFDKTKGGCKVSRNNHRDCLCKNRRRSSRPSRIF
jgi:hypothetical protein